MYSDRESLKKIFSDAGFIDIGTGQYLSGRGIGDVGQAKAVVSAQQNNLINSIYTLGSQLSNAGINSQVSIKNNNLIFEYWDSKDPSSKETITQPLPDMNTVGKNIENFVGVFVRNKLQFVANSAANIAIANQRMATEWGKQQLKTNKVAAVKQIFQWAKKDVLELSSTAGSEAISDVFKETTAGSAAVNAQNAQRVKLKPYFQGVAFASGIDFEKFNNELYEMFALVTMARDFQTAKKVLDSDPTFKKLRENKQAYEKALRLFNSARNQSFGLGIAATSETSQEGLTFSFGGAETTIDPLGGARPAYKRGQHRPAQMKMVSDVKLFTSPIASKHGEGLGLKYGRKATVDRGEAIPFDALLKGMEVKESDLKGTGMSIHGGQMEITPEAAEMFGTAMQEFNIILTPDDIQDFIEKEQKKKRNKNKTKEQLMETLVNKTIGETGLSDVDFQKLVDEETGAITLVGSGRKAYKDFQRVTSASGIRAATHKSTKEAFSQLTSQLQGVEDEEISFIVGQSELNSRNYQEVLEQDIRTVFAEAYQNKLGASQKGLKELKETIERDAATEGDFKEIAGIFKDAFEFDEDSGLVYVTNDWRQKMQESSDQDIFGRALLYIDNLIHDEQEKDKHFYSETVDDAGRLIVKRNDQVRRYFYDAVSATDQYRYGEWSQRGAVSLSSGADSLRRLAGTVSSNVRVGGRKLTPEEIVEAANSIAGRLEPTKEQQEMLDKAQKAEEEARNLTLSTMRSDFTRFGDDVVVIGRGADAGINISDIKPAAEYKYGKPTNEEEMLVGRIEEYKKKYIQEQVARGVAEEEAKKMADALKFAIDLEQGVSSSVKYGDRVYGVGGKYLVLREGFDAQTGGAKEAQSLINAINEGKTDAVSGRFASALKASYEDVHTKRGQTYKRIWKQKQPESMYGSVGTFGAADVLTDEEYEKADNVAKLKSDIASAGAVISAKTAKKMLKATDIKELREMYSTFSGIEDVEGLKKGDLIENIIKYLTIDSDEFKQAASSGRLKEGIRSVAGRLPFMSGLDMNAINKLFIASDLEDDGVRLSLGGALKMNADYDGDKVAIARIKDLNEQERALYDAMAERTSKVLRTMALIEKANQEKADKESETVLGSEQSDILKNKNIEFAASIASRFGKSSTGIFSNIASELRAWVKEEGLDEISLLESGGGDADQIKTAIQASIMRSFFEAMEQDVISSKKTINRMAKIQRQKDTGVDSEDFKSESEMEEFYLKSVFSVRDLVNRFFDRENGLTFKELVDTLQEMGVVDGSDENAFLKGRVPQQLMASAEGMVAGRSDADDILKSVFGENFKSFVELSKSGKEIEYGKLSKNVVMGAIENMAGSLGVDVEDLLSSATRHKYTPEKQSITEENMAYWLSGKQLINKSVLDPTFYEQIVKNANEAEDAVDSERVAEEKKIKVAKDETKAILEASRAYGTLSGQLADAKDAYDKFGTGKSYGATAHDIASLLNPSSYTVVEGKSISRDALAEQIVSATSAKSDSELYKIKKELGESNYIQALKETTEALDKRSDERLAAQSGLTGTDLLKERNRLVREAKQNAEARLGFKGAIKEFRDKRESFIHTQEGTYIHALAQQIDTAGNDDVINAEVEKQRALLGAQMRSLGFAESEITKRVEKASKSAKALYDKTKSFGNVDFTEQKLTSTESGSQGFVHGAADAIAIDENGNITIIDWKTGQKSITDENKAQVAVYQSILEEYRGKLKNIYEKSLGGNFALRNTSGDNSYVEDIIDQFYKENIVHEGLKARFGEEGAKDLLRKILLTGGGREDAEGNRIFDQAIRGAIVLSNSQGISSWSGAGGIPPVLAEKLLYSPESLTRDEKAIIYAGGTYIPSGSSTGKKGKGKSSGGGGSSEKENSLKSEYIKLLKEQYDIMIKINALEHKRDEMLGRGEDVTAVKKDIDVLNSALEQQKDALSDKRFKKTAKDKGVLDYVSTQEHRVSYQKSLLGIGDAEDALKAFERYATKRMKLESEIEQAQLKASTTVGNEKKAWENVVALKQQSLDKTKETYNILEQQARKKVGDQRVDEITEAVKEQSAILSAQKFAGNRGNRTIFDVIKSDIQRATMRIADFGLTAKVLNTARKEIQQVYQNILKLDEAMTNLRIVTGSNTEQAKSMMNTYNDLAMQLGTTTQAVAQSAAEWLRQGYSVSEANELIKSSTYLSRLGFMDMNQSVTALTSVMKGFRIEAADSMDIVDKLTQLDAKYATTAGDIATALSRTSAVAREAGLNLDQTAAALTTMIDVSQQDASSVGNAFRTILARYGNVKATAFASLVGDSDDIDDTNKSINDTEKVLGAIGIKIRSSAGDMRDFYEVMDELAEVYPTLDEVSRNAVATALGGTRQRNLLSIMIQNWSQVKESQEEAEKAQGTAARKMQAYNESVAYSINQLSAAWEGFTQKLEASPAVKDVYWILTQGIKNLDHILQYLMPVIATFNADKIVSLAKFLSPLVTVPLKGIRNPIDTVRKFKGDFYENMTQKMTAENTNAIEELTNATRDNTAALRGEKPRGGNVGVGKADEGATPKGPKTDVVTTKQKPYQKYTSDVRSRIDSLNYHISEAEKQGNVSAVEKLKKIKSEELRKIEGNKLEIISAYRKDTRDATELAQKQINEIDKRTQASKANALMRKEIAENAHKNGQVQSKLKEKDRRAEASQIHAAEMEASGEQQKEQILKERNDRLKEIKKRTKKDLREENKRLKQQEKEYNRANSTGRAKTRTDVKELTPEERANLEVQKKLERSARLNTGAVSGIGAGAVRFANKGSSFLDEAMGVSGVEVDTGEAIAMGVAQSALTGVATAFMGPAGAVLASIFGDILSSLWKKIAHADEIDRKQRVEDAKKQLEAIKGIESSVIGLIDLNKKNQALWDSDEWKQFNEQVETINEALEKSELGDKIIDLGNKTQTLSEYFEEAAKTGNENMLARVEAERIRFEAEQTYAAGEQDRYILQKEISENQKKLTKLDDDEASKKKELNAAIKSAKAEIDDYSEALKRGYMQASFYSSGVGTMDSYDVGSATLDRVIVQIAREWAKDSPDIFAGNQLTSDARSNIISYLREQSSYSSLFKNDTKNVGDMLTARDAVDDLRKSLNMSQKQLKEFANSKDLLKIGKSFGLIKDDIIDINQLSEADKSAVYKLIDKINLVDEDGIITIAHAMNMTVEEFERANADGAFNWLTADVAIGGIDKLNEKMQTFNDLLSAASEGSLLTSENLNKIANQFPTLLRGVDEAGKYTKDLSSDNILDNIIRMMTDEDSLREIYSGLFSGSVAKDSEIWNNFMTLGKGSEIANSNLSEEIKERIKKAGSYSDIVDIFAMDKMKEYNDAFKEYVTSMYPITDLLDTQAKILEEYGKYTLETEISNLESVRDSLDDVNKQREKELELIKAKEALENALKEKKRIYRAGVGFVYTTDQEAVKSAQGKVDELERQRDKDNIQYQIDSLQQQKEILENIENNKQLESLVDTAERILGSDGSNNGIAGIITAVNSITSDEFINKIKEQVKTGITESTQKTNDESKESAYKSYKEAQSSLEDFRKEEYVTPEGEKTGYAKGDILNNPRSPYYSSVYDEYKSKIDNINKYAENYNKYAQDDSKKISKEKAEESKQKFGFFAPASGLKRVMGAKSGKVFVFGISPSVNPNWASNDQYTEGNSSNIYISKQTGNGGFGGFEQSTWKGTAEEAINKVKGPALIVNNKGGKDYLIYKDVNGEIHNTVVRLTDGSESLDGELTYDAFFDGKVFSGNKGLKALKKIADNYNPFASGTVSAPGGLSLINENGLESIITPSGTITSLPAKSGIVPADLTRNLWALGEVAPNLIARLGGNSLQTNNSNSSTDNSINIQNLDATFNTQSDFDGRRFLTDLRNQVILTANNH